MLSEHFRVFLSLFARACNAHLMRKGVVVMKKFEKIPVRTEMNYYKEFEWIYDLKFCSYSQIKEKYQPDRSLYDREKEMVNVEGQIHSLKSSIRVYKGLAKLEKLPVALEMVRPFSSVLRKILNKDQNDKNNENPRPKLE